MSLAFRSCAFAAVLAFATSNSGHAQEADLTQLALKASSDYLGMSIACAPVTGEAQVGAARTIMQGTLRTLGLGSDKAIIYVDDLETTIRKGTAGRSPFDDVGKDGVTRADVIQSCTELLSESLHKVEVANARLRQAQ